MPDLNVHAIKAAAARLGADLCGIAAGDSFMQAPEGYLPRDPLPSCRSVIVLARRFPARSLDGGPERYTRARDRMAVLVNGLSGSLAEFLAGRGAVARVQPSMGTGSWKADGRYRDALSLKHAAVLAGLGAIGRNYLLINHRFGNMIWLGAVLTDLALAPDPPAEYQACPDGCRACDRVCPAGALRNGEIDQRACFGHAYSYPDDRELITCWSCRRGCPRRFGIRGG